MLAGPASLRRLGSYSAEQARLEYDFWRLRADSISSLRVIEAEPVRWPGPAMWHRNASPVSTRPTPSRTASLRLACRPVCTLLGHAGVKSRCYLRIRQTHQDIGARGRPGLPMGLDAAPQGRAERKGPSAITSSMRIDGEYAANSLQVRFLRLRNSPAGPETTSSHRLCYQRAAKSQLEDLKHQNWRRALVA